VTRLQLINEIVITAMETIGMILAAFGLGVFAAWVTGVAGFLLVSGAGMIGAAYIAARAQREQIEQATSKQPPPEPPMGLVNTAQTVQRYMAERQAASVQAASVQSIGTQDGVPL
jgi:hypothetical protein